MKRGLVVGRYWSTRKVDSLPQGALLEVEFPDGSRLIAVDPLGCNEGESVLVAEGSVASHFFGEPFVVVDAVIVGSLDDKSA
ncbi:MAG: ethanolamine utilization protein EutN [Nevskiaceae bacterium]|nr:MAG: ethanolamine utilization protein EutN [Nevskiaceae bacterium]TBR73266.1 MAG: ethanolamine utilization protein EutN [Nevskiaceae bacterium]